MDIVTLLVVALIGLALFVAGWFIIYLEKTPIEELRKIGVLLPREREAYRETKESAQNDLDYIRKTSQQ